MIAALSYFVLCGLCQPCSRKIIARFALDTQLSAAIDNFRFSLWLRSLQKKITIFYNCLFINDQVIHFQMSYIHKTRIDDTLYYFWVLRNYILCLQSNCNIEIDEMRQLMRCCLSPQDHWSGPRQRRIVCITIKRGYFSIVWELYSWTAVYQH